MWWQSSGMSEHVGCQGIPDQAPHFSEGSRKEREEERRGVRGGADTAVGCAVRRDPWRSTAGILQEMCRLLAQPGGDAVPGVQDVSCSPVGSNHPESQVWLFRNIRCPFLSFPFRAVPLCFPLPCHKHPAGAGGRKQTLEKAEGAWPAPCEPSAQNGEVEVIPQEVPLKSPAAALPGSFGPVPQRISHRVFPACPSQQCPT